jgi:hypothetical protein
MELMPVKIALFVEAHEAIAELKKVSGEMDRIAAKSQFASGKLGGFQRAGVIAGTALKAIGGSFAFMAYEGIKASMALQTSQARLQTAVKNTGVSFAAAKPVIDKHAEAMMNLGFTTQDTYEALGTMTTATRSPQMALDALAASADLARYKHMSLAEAGKLVASASTGQARGLRDLGLAMNKTIPAGTSFAGLMKLIHARTKDAAKAFADTSAGQLEVLRAKFEGLKEELGNSLMPAFNKIVSWILKDGIPRLKDLGKWFSDNKPIIIAFGTALAALWAVPKITGILRVLTTLGDAYLAMGRKATIAAGEEALATGGEVAAGAGIAGGGAAAIAGAGAAAGAAAIAIPAIAAGVGFGLYEAGTSKAKPTMPKIGGKAGGAAMAEYRRKLADWEKANSAQKIPAKTAPTASPNLKGYGPAPLITKASKGKTTSLRSQMKEKVGTATTSHTSVLKLDSKVIAKSTATSAAHGSPLATGHTK